MKQSKTLSRYGKDAILLMIKGAIVGTGAILPGVSGGVLMAAFGIYEPVMQVLSHPKEGWKKHGRMMTFFLFGWIAGFLLLAKVVEMIFLKNSFLAIMIFAGLILGTVPGILKEANAKRYWPMAISLVVFGGVFTLMRSNVAVTITPNAFWYLFCGLIWGLSLVIPGLSSSSLLILLGLYVPMTSGIASLDPMVILPLATGIVITVLCTAKTINHLFETHRGMMLQVVAGIMIASTLFIFPPLPSSLPILAGGIICMGLSFLAAHLMGKASR